ncbi:hypothetical protein JTB14_022441 [Gonioctena quinquepunctata]|nr:hypothetical protein JTB14_022441 [Gonioctena quinquepunctata]
MERPHPSDRAKISTSVFVSFQLSKGYPKANERKLRALTCYKLYFHRYTRIGKIENEEMETKDNEEHKRKKRSARKTCLRRNENSDLINGEEESEISLHDDLDED